MRNLPMHVPFPLSIPPLMANPVVTTKTVAPRVVIVEDDVSFTEILTFMLRELGLDVFSFDRAHRALEFLQNSASVDLVLLDVHLGHREDGWEFLRNFRQSLTHGQTPVVVMTGLNLEGRRPPDASPDALLNKPVSLKNLIGILERFVNLPPERAALML